MSLKTNTAGTWPMGRQQHMIGWQLDAQLPGVHGAAATTRQRMAGQAAKPSPYHDPSTRCSLCSLLLPKRASLPTRHRNHRGTHRPPSTAGGDSLAVASSPPEAPQQTPLASSQPFRRQARREHTAARRLGPSDAPIRIVDLRKHSCNHPPHKHTKKNWPWAATPARTTENTTTRRIPGRSLAPNRAIRIATMRPTCRLSRPRPPTMQKPRQVSGTSGRGIRRGAGGFK